MRKYVESKLSNVLFSNLSGRNYVMVRGGRVQFALYDFSLSPSRIMCQNPVGRRSAAHMILSPPQVRRVRSLFIPSTVPIVSDHCKAGLPQFSLLKTRACSISRRGSEG